MNIWKKNPITEKENQNLLSKIINFKIDNYNYNNNNNKN